MPIGLRIADPVALAGARIVKRMGLVPHPHALVLGVIEYPTERSHGPAARGTDAAGHTLLVQIAHDPRERLPVGKGLKDTLKSGRRA